MTSLQPPIPPIRPDAARGRFLRNAWYVAAWADDLGEEPLAKTFLDDPVALFRDEAGIAHAIAGRCPHRFAPLGHGTMVGSHLQCPYHGLRFDGTGACVFNPHEKGIVPQVSVPVYPLVERYRLLWIWMGEPARADDTLIPDFAWLAEPRWDAVRGTAYAEGHYELYSDNILDLAHANFVHPALAANSWTIGKRQFRQDGDRVYALYTHADDFLSEGISAILSTQGRKQDLWVEIRWDAPATHFLDFRAGEPGTPVDQLVALPSLHAFTPETADATHYFWATARDFAVGDEGFSTIMRDALANAFEHEDMPIIRDVHRLMAGHDFWDLRPIVLTGDSGGVRARRVLKRLIDEEQAGDRMAAE